MSVLCGYTGTGSGIPCQNPADVGAQSPSESHGSSPPALAPPAGAAFELDELLAPIDPEISKQAAELLARAEADVRELFRIRHEVHTSNAPDKAPLMAVLDEKLDQYPSDMRGDQEALERALSRAAEVRALHPEQGDHRRFIGVARGATGTHPDIDVDEDRRVTPELIERARQRLIAEAAVTAAETDDARARLETMSRDDLIAVLAEAVPPARRFTPAPFDPAHPRFIGQDRRGAGYFLGWDPTADEPEAHYFAGSHNEDAVTEAWLDLGVRRPVVFASAFADPIAQPPMTLCVKIPSWVADGLAGKAAHARLARLRTNTAA
jgi:hypothetical protein